MAGGQMLDLEAEGSPLSAAEIARLQFLKTGRLITFACEAGAILSQATPLQRAALLGYGNAIGSAFQISDDLLDAEGDPAEVGKATAKDAPAGKATLVALLGTEGARTALARRVSEAEDFLTIFGPRAAILNETAHYMTRRQA